MIRLRHFCLLLAVLVWVVQTASGQSADSAQPILDCMFRGGNDLFAPEQPIVLDVILRNASTSAPLSLRATLTNLSQQFPPFFYVVNTNIIPNVPLPVSFTTPDKEGVYEITLTIVQSVEAPFARPFPRLVAVSTQSVVEVRRQFIVVNPQVAPRAVGSWMLSDTRDLLTAAPVDSSSRRQLFSLPKVSLPKITDLPKPNLLKHSPFSRQNAPNPSTDSSELIEQVPGMEPWLSEPLKRFPGMESVYLPESQGQFLEQSESLAGFSALSPAGMDGCTWYSLPMDVEVGKPYLVEIDYPANVPQTLGIGIADTSSSRTRDGCFNGMVNVAANLHVAEEIVQAPKTETTATHQLLFWATTKSQELLLVNKQPDREALFRNIRISQVGTYRQGELQPLPKLFEGTAQRKRIAQLLGGYSFQGRAVSGDYTIFNPLMTRQESYERSSRLIDTLCRGGYDGLTLPVLSTYSQLYPTEKIADRKNIAQIDCLEMVFQQFDKEELTLIPAIEFNVLLSSLEQLVLQHPEVADEIRGNGLYNLLHPAVQQAMAEVVLELVDRFGEHPSFGGVAIVLSPATYAQLPFSLHPPDDYTFTQFQQETEQALSVPFPDEQNFRTTMPTQQFLAKKNAGRIQFLQSNPKVWETWVRWRGAKVSGFYADLAKQVSARRLDAPLYLLGGTMFDTPEIQEFCRPTLPRNSASLQAMQLLGFDLPLVSRAESLLFLKPVQISETKNFSDEGVNSADTTVHFSKSGIVPGVQFVHRGGDGGTVACSMDAFVTTPAHLQSRKRFVQQLAQADVLMFLDGGVSLPFGQESAMFDVLDTYRRLPPVPFQTFQPPDNFPTLQPLTVRYKHTSDGTIVYIVNDAPFAVEADFLFHADSPSDLTELTGHRTIRSFNRSPQRNGGYTWRASLLPYDLLAIRIGDTNAKIESVTVHRPPSLCGAEGVFRQKVEELTRRVHTARNGIFFDGLVNANFELPLDEAGGIVGWQCFGTSLSASLAQKTVGQHCVKLANSPNDPGMERSAVSGSEPGTFLSQPFTLPPTGRLGVSMYVGIPAEFQSLPMSVVLSAKYQDKPFFRSIPVEETFKLRLMNVEPQQGIRWHRLVTTFERLPVESLEEVQMGIQYSGSGTVWLDDVMLYSVMFSSGEMREMQTLLVVADRFCTLGRVSDLMSLLEGYWTHYLFQHVPVSVPLQATATPKPSVAKEVPPSAKPTWYQRAKGLVGW